MIAINNLSISFSKSKILNNLSLSLKEGTIYSLIGPSGCGKSTLLKILCGILPNYEGEISRDGQSIKKQPISIGYVPQSYGLLDWKTIEKNITLPYKIHGEKIFSPKEIDDVLQELEITDLLKRYPSEISGGQKQRVALARALITKPNLLLMDEPFSALDAFTSASAQKLFLKLWEKHKTTTLFITHNVYEALEISEQIILMDKSGVVIEIIDNPTFNHPDEQNRIALKHSIIQKLGQNV